MFWHYFVSAFLAVKSQGKYTLINILGLVTGLCAALILLMIIVSESGFDKYHPESQRLARVEVVFDSLDNTHIASVAGAMGPELLQRGLVDNSARLFRQETKLRVGQRQYLEQGFVYTDVSASELFQFEVISGDLKYALSRPFGLAITETTAKRWFGQAKPLNQTVITASGEPLQVLAIIADLPRHTHLEFDMLTGMATLESEEGHQRLESWMRNDFYTYVQLPKHRTSTALEAQVTAILSAPLLKIVPGLKLHFELQPITDIHLHGHAMNEMKVNGDATQIRVFASLILVILFVAIFNYINFATATAGRRAKEIGVRQVSGASRSSMIIQFMCESGLLVSVAFLLAMISVLVAIPLVNDVFNQSLDLTMLLQGHWLSWAMLLFVGVVIGSGSYPALVLSSIPTLSALKGAGFKGKSGNWFRRTVLFIQLSSAVCLAIWGGHIYTQMSFIENTPLGYDKQNKLVLTNISTDIIMESFPALQSKLQGYNLINSVAAAEFIPTQSHGNLVALRTLGNPDNALGNVMINTVSVGFFDTLGIKMLAGRDFLPSEQETAFRSGRNEAIPIVINQAALAQLNLGGIKAAVGQQIELGWDPDYNKASLGRIIAVVDDYFTTSLKVDKRPMVFTTGEMTQSKNQLVISFNRGGYLSTLAEVRNVWSTMFAAQLPSYQLLTSRFDDLYRLDRLRSSMINAFNVLTLVVITFGVLGLCSFSAQRRLKEFALRRLMGASNVSLGWILGREFLISVLVASIAMMVPTWWLTEQWLNQFVSRVGIQWWLYLLAPCILVIIITMIVASILAMLRHVNLSATLRNE